MAVTVKKTQVFLPVIQPHHAYCENRTFDVKLPGKENYGNLISHMMTFFTIVDD